MQRTTIPLLLVVLVAVLVPHRAGTIEALAVTYGFNLESQPLGRALQDFAIQSHMQIIFLSRLTDGRTGPAICGRHTVDVALGMLLYKSGLTYRFVNPMTIQIRGSEPAVKP